MKHFLFTEEMTGEQFLVSADDEISAILIAQQIGENIADWYGNDSYVITSQGEMTEGEAEASGLDEIWKEINKWITIQIISTLNGGFPQLVSPMPSPSKEKFFIPEKKEQSMS